MSVEAVVTVITDVEVTFLILLKVMPLTVISLTEATLLTSIVSTEVILSNGFRRIPDVAFKVLISPVSPETVTLAIVNLSFPPVRSYSMVSALVVETIPLV